MTADPVAKPGLRERKKQEKLDRIKRAARALFSKRGFHSTTIRDVAARAGVATGTVFLYAKDKADLLLILFSDAVTEVQDEAFATLPTRRPGAAALLVAQLTHVFGRFFTFYDRDRALSRLFVKELLFTDAPRSAQHFALTFAFLDRIGQLVAAAQERGEIRGDLEPQRAAMLFFGTYFLTLVGFLDSSEVIHLELEAAIARLTSGLTLQIEGLRPPSPSSAPEKPRTRRAAGGKRSSQITK